MLLHDKNHISLTIWNMNAEAIFRFIGRKELSLTDFEDW